MPDTKHKPHPTQGPRGHPLPRRSSPENSVTLRHHRLARDVSTRASPGASAQAADAADPPTSPRRNSSGNSHDTGNSDPRRWFDKSNRNASARFDTHAMDVDPPFFQKERELPGQYDSKADFRFDLMSGPTPGLKHAVTHSSSADDYRSVIDDLTVEIQRLKNELRRYKQLGPDELKKEKLFEVKVHGLPKRKKRELEATLRDFAASLHGTPSADTSSSQRDKSNRHGNRLYSASATMSKHASSSSGSRSRPVDSAYASGSTGPNSSGTSLTRPSFSSRARSSEQKVENYLKDIPEGLYPHHAVMTDKEKKKLVVRRLEQLFTGKIGGRNVRRTQPAQDTAAPPSIDRSASAAPSTAAAAQPPGLAPEAAREARILPPYASKKKNGGSQDRGSTSNSNGDQTESGGNGSGPNTSPPTAPPPEQRPTRPRDLDPDRIQNPSENMEYIRHLGLVPPGLLPPSETAQHVSPDADGWVYLNLLCNLAQLHIFNVTPDFIRTAVSEKSAKFQLSPDGRKIRWRGGSTGTKFSSDSSGDNSQKNSSNDDSSGSGKGSSRRKRKQQSSGYDGKSASSGKHRSKLGNDTSRSSDSFHYKPLFVRQNSSNEQTSLDDTGSSYGPGEDSGVGDSRWGQSGSNSSPQKRRRLDGAIIYYSGAPFCTDLSGDPGDMSPNAYIRSDDHQQHQSLVILGSGPRPSPHRTDSGSSLKFRPLSDNARVQGEEPRDHDTKPPSLSEDGEDDEDDEDEDSDFEMDFSWANTEQLLEVQPLEPCGLGGVTPEDNFVVVVTTRRPKITTPPPRAARPPRVDESADSIISRLAGMTTHSPGPRVIPTASKPPAFEIDYLAGKIRRLAPASLPPPAVLYPPFSTDESTNSLDMSESEADSDNISEVEFMSRRANPHQSDNTYPEDAEITSADEEGEDPDDEPPVISSKEGRVLHRKGREAFAERRRAEPRRLSSASATRAPPLRRHSKSVEAPGSDSSAATAGGAENEFSSSD